MSTFVRVSSNPEEEKRFSLVAYSVLIVVILLSTYVHHVLPQVLNVPSNTDISSWESPPFEHTWIYDRMNDEEKTKLLSEGIPGTDIVTLLIYEILSIFGAWLCFVHARKHYSTTMASCFLIGSFVFTGLQESIMILSGRFLWGAGKVDPDVWGSYWFPQGLFWFFETPVWVCLCWFLIAYSCVWVAGKIFPRMGLWKRAVAGGLIAMIIDLWEDPVLTSPEMMKWVWAKGDSIGILGIPHGNFMGWFFLIFWFAILWEKYLPRFTEKWGLQKGCLVFLGIILISNIAILAILITWGGIVNAVLHPDIIMIPPQRWGW